MADFNEIAKQFVAHYYTTFDTDRKNLAPLYREGSMLTFQSDQLMGAASIGEKLAGLPFTKVVHKYDRTDAQPTPSGILIVVAGQLLVDDGEQPLSYTQTFLLAQDPSGSYYVQNDIFNLVVF
ncbi:nuclear transport factor 2 [Podospora aff. communis PSN243]|uniref:Nuclear transport factor 2 n=1 Tax=Podospora aff. communis PSN243 TaxID=3040156 RepID=A0AAV9H0J7_9PEZI|nr:nuclear transport factor 2 [Podospora aff. communis PSN243]